MSNESKVAQQLEKAKEFLLKIIKACAECKDPAMNLEAQSLQRLVDLLQMHIDSLISADEHRQRMAMLGGGLKELQADIDKGEARLQEILKEGHALCKLDPNSESFADEFLKMGFKNPELNEIVKLSKEDPEKAFKQLEEIIKPKPKH